MLHAFRTGSTLAVTSCAASKIAVSALVIQRLSTATRSEETILPSRGSRRAFRSGSRKNTGCSAVYFWT